MTTTQFAEPASSQLIPVLGRFFETKTAADIEGTMSYFSPDMVTYIDATLGWEFAGYEALKGVFTQYMPNWHAPARSYATRIFANAASALVNMTDTPELFGGELRILAAIDFADGKIVRWVDYWDSSAYDPALYNQFRAPAEQFPRDLKDSRVSTQAAPEVINAATALQKSFRSEDPSAAGAILHTDVVFEDMALRTQVIGRIETLRYLERVLGRVPYGRSSQLRHVVGGPEGGGFEWTAGPDSEMLVGITALALDASGLITRVTSTYDSRQLEPDRKADLILASVPH